MLLTFNRKYGPVARDLEIPEEFHVDVPENYVADDPQAHMRVDGKLKLAARNTAWDGDVFVYGHSAFEDDRRLLSAHRRHWDGYRLGRMLEAHLFRYDSIVRPDRVVMIMGCYIGQYVFLEELAEELVHRGVRFARVEGTLSMVSPSWQVPYKARRRQSIHLASDPWNAEKDKYVTLRDRRPHDGSVYTVRTRAGEARLEKFPKILAARAADKLNVVRTIRYGDAQQLALKKTHREDVSLGNLFGPG